MIAPIDLGLRRIHFNIPDVILKAAFSQRRDPTRSPSIDTNIIRDLIDNIILPDCNIKGGKVEDIILQAAWVLNTPEEPYSMFRIPPEARSNRNITDVVQVTRKALSTYPSGIGAMDIYPTWPPTSAYTNAPAFHANAILPLANAVLNSKTLLSENIDPVGEVMGNNIIKLRPQPNAFIPWCVVCKLEYDSNFTNLNSAAIEKFADLCVLGAKAYCYNTLITEIDRGYMEFGTELPTIKDILSQYGSIYEQYTEKCSEFANASMWDLRRMSNLIWAAL